MAWPTNRKFDKGNQKGKAFKLNVVKNKSGTVVQK